MPDFAQCFVGPGGPVVIIMGNHMHHKLLSAVPVLGGNDIENSVVSQG